MGLNELLKRKQEMDRQVKGSFNAHSAKCKHHIGWTDRIPVDRCTNPIGQFLSDTPWGYICECELGRCPTIDK